MNDLLLADADSTASGLAGIMGLVWLHLVAYGNMAFFVPIYFFRTMRRTTQILPELRVWRTGSAGTPALVPPPVFSQCKRLWNDYYVLEPKKRTLSRWRDRGSNKQYKYKCKIQ
jgi:hypothetical protein